MTDMVRLVVMAIAGLVAAGAAAALYDRFTAHPAVLRGMSIEELVAGVKTELRRLQNVPGPPLGLELSEVALTMSIDRERGTSGEGKLVVPVFDELMLSKKTATTDHRSSKVSIVLVPPKGSEILSSDKPTIEFADLLLEVRRQLQATMASEPRLDAKSIQVDLGFELTAKRTDKAAVKVSVLGLDAERTASDKSGNTIVLKYANPKFATDKSTTKPAAP